MQGGLWSEAESRLPVGSVIWPGKLQIPLWSHHVSFAWDPLKMGILRNSWLFIEILMSSGGWIGTGKIRGLTRLA